MPPEKRISYAASFGFEEFPEKEDEPEQNEQKNLAMKIIYNDKRLGILKKKEIAKLTKKIKYVK